MLCIVYKSVVQVKLYYCIKCILYKLQCIVVYNVSCTSCSVLLYRMYVVQVRMYYCMDCMLYRYIVLLSSVKCKVYNVCCTSHNVLLNIKIHSR